MMGVIGRSGVGPMSGDEHLEVFADPSESLAEVLAPRKMPAQRPGKSKQDYATPLNFIKACEVKFGKIVIDLAATKENRVCSAYFGPDHHNSLLRDSFEVDWRKYLSRTGIAWLNPPFGDIGPWAERCSVTKLLSRQRILFLVPASVGSEWFAKSVFKKSGVYAVRPRLSFDGKDPYPKDCCLCVYGEKPGFKLWRYIDDLR